MIREGTAAHNLKALMPLLTQQYYSRCMFATDDKHPSDLLYGGHIDYIVKQALKNGADPIVALKTATHHAARYFCSITKVRLLRVILPILLLLIILKILMLKLFSSVASLF